MISISIPVERHVHKYLMIRYGKKHTASKRSLLGLQVIQALRGKYKKPVKRIPNFLEYDVEIPEHCFRSGKQAISKSNLLHLGICMGTLFDEDLCKYLDIQVSQGKKALPELKAWLAFHLINENDVKVETLYKVYQRHCKGPISAKKNVA